MIAAGNPPVLRIDLASPLPVYLQISQGLRALLVAGTLAPGDRLPTVRQLAVDLGVHHNTVAEAYRLLAEEGWLELKRRLGATVVSRPQPAPSEEAEQSFRKRLRELVAESLARGVPAASVAAHLRETAGGLP